MWLALGAITGFLAVALGAFGAHALRERLSPEMLTIFETGARYQLTHAVVIVAVAAFGVRRRLPLLAGVANSFFLAGVLLFSGSLYLLSLSGMRSWGAVTPFGGGCLLIAWGCLAWLGISLSRRRNRY